MLVVSASSRARLLCRRGALGASELGAAGVAAVGDEASLELLLPEAFCRVGGEAARKGGGEEAGESSSFLGLSGGWYEEYGASIV